MIKLKNDIMDAINESVNEVNIVEIQSFITFVVGLRPNNLMSDETMDEVMNHIHENNQEDILDFIYRVQTNLILALGLEEYKKLLDRFEYVHTSIIDYYKNSDDGASQIYYDSLSVDNWNDNKSMRGIIYMLNLAFTNIAKDHIAKGGGE